MMFHKTQQPNGCLSACIACIFNLSQDDVPLFHGGAYKERCVQYSQFCEWCKHILQVVPVVYTESQLAQLVNHPKRLVIGSGRYKKGHHAVVANQDCVVHDPSGLGFELEDLNSFYVFAKKGAPTPDIHLHAKADWSVAYLHTIRWMDLAYFRHKGGEIEGRSYRCFIDVAK